MRNNDPAIKPMRTTAPPTATPAMVPVPILLDDGLLKSLVVAADGVGKARVGVRDANTAFCAKYTERSALSNPPGGEVDVAPPEDLYLDFSKYGDPL